MAEKFRLESQISLLRKQYEEHQHQASIIVDLRRNITRNTLLQQEYSSLFLKFRNRSKPAIRESDLSATTSYTAPETKASVAVKQLVSKIQSIMEKEMDNQDIQVDISGLSEPLAALLRSSTVKPDMILEQMIKNMDRLQANVDQAMDHKNSFEIQCKYSIDSKGYEVVQCEEREAKTEDNLKKQQHLKYKADELVRDIKSKIATHYPDDEVQRMLL
jgi:hypothetical protein